MSGADNVVDQVFAQVHDARVRLAMLFGAGVEGGWGPTFNVGDSGHSWGPYQVNMQYHNDITPAEASDPALAVDYMKGAYASAAKRVPDAMWKNDPLHAAEATAVMAERPQGYPSWSAYEALGSPVTSAYQRAAKAVASSNSGIDWGSVLGDAAGIGVGSAAGAAGQVVGAGVDAAGGVAGGAVGKAAGAVADGFSAALGPIFDDFRTFGLTVTFAGLGLALIALGAWRVSQPVRDKVKDQAETAAKTAAEVGAVAA